jgi:transposase
MSEQGRKGRFIGIRHRVKKTAGGEARPTQLVIISSQGDPISRELPDETAELDWVLGRFPTSWCFLNKGERRSQFLEHHVREKKHKKRKRLQVPDELDGLQPNDTVVMSLGGSGDYLAFALSRQAEEIGARILRIPPFVLKEQRGKRDKDEDALTLAEIGLKSPELCYPVFLRDRQFIWLRETLQTRIDAMKARIACEQRLHQRIIGQAFCSEDGLFPEGSIAKLFDEAKASDRILTVLLEEQKEREQELLQALQELNVYTELFEPIEGVGLAIAAPIIAGIGDIRRFPTAAKLKAFCGVHVLPDGRFPRKREGEIANWKPWIRQALYLLGDQCNRRPKSIWGQKLLDYKAKFRAKYPEVIIVDGKKRYTNAHIHRMATWRTLTKFVEWLYREWWKLEKSAESATQ